MERFLSAGVFEQAQIPVFITRPLDIADSGVPHSILSGRDWSKRARIKPLSQRVRRADIWVGKCVWGACPCRAASGSQYAKASSIHVDGVRSKKKSCSVGYNTGRLPAAQQVTEP